MGDMREVFDLMREANKQRKEKNLANAEPFLKFFTKHTQWHYSTYLNGERVDWWPSTNKWRVSYKNYNGDAVSLMNFLTKRGWKTTYAKKSKRNSV